MPTNWLFWVLFNAFVLLMLVLDLGMFNRRDHAIRLREALAWTAMWVSLAAIFAILLAHFGHLMTGHMHRPNRVLSLEFVTGYLVEYSLSVDNLFVFLLIFSYFRVPKHLQHKVLFWGILGALVLRLIFILAGVALINRFHWIIYVFGAFLVYVGLKLMRGQEQGDPGKSPIVKFFRKHLRLTEDYEGNRFSVLKNGVRWFTPLALVLLVVETTDVIFATDSIPAVLAITRDPFIVFTSNVFAILGLRSLYFALAGLMDLFHLLHYGLAVILMFIGIKMLVSNYYEMPIEWALGVVVGVLAVSIVASLVFPKKAEEKL